MAHINRLLKGALISTAGVVGSLMLTKHFTKNKSLKHIPPFFDKPTLTSSLTAVACLNVLNKRNLLSIAR